MVGPGWSQSQVSTNSEVEIQVVVKYDLNCDVYQELLARIESGEIVESEQVRKEDIVLRLNEYCGGAL